MSIYVRFLFLTGGGVNVFVGISQGGELIKLNACFCVTVID